MMRGQFSCARHGCDAIQLWSHSRRLIVYLTSISTLVACHSQPSSSSLPSSEEPPQLTLGHGDVGCFVVKPAGPMIARDSALLGRIGVLWIDTEVVGTTFPGLRRIKVGKALSPLYTMNAWRKDSLTDSVHWYIGHAYGGVSFTLLRKHERLSGSASEVGDAAPIVRRMGDVVADAVSCPKGM